VEITTGCVCYPCEYVEELGRFTSDVQSYMPGENPFGRRVLRTSQRFRRGSRHEGKGGGLERCIREYRKEAKKYAIHRPTIFREIIITSPALARKATRLGRFLNPSKNFEPAG